MTVKTVSEMHSWIIFSCINEKGPPVIWLPIRLAGIITIYSSSATPHESRMIRISGQSLVMFNCSSLRLPYQASVMKTLLTTSSRIEINPFDIIGLGFKV